MEDEYPGLWRLWLKHQCVTDGHSPDQGCHLEGETKGGRDWIQARNALNEIETGDEIVAGLPGRRIGRIGQVICKKVGDKEWNHLVESINDPEWPKGYMGRRIEVRWDLEHSPDNWDLVVQLPEGFNLGRGTLNRVHSTNANKLRKVMGNQANWVGLASRFGYERALSDYIALYPHRLEDGLVPYPNDKVCERVFKDSSRLDVLLLDKNDKPVIVECKQESPTVEDVGQLRHYLKTLEERDR
jgi:Endonuclease NucS